MTAISEVIMNGVIMILTVVAVLAQDSPFCPIITWFRATFLVHCTFDTMAKDVVQNFAWHRQQYDICDITFRYTPLHNTDNS